MIKQGVLFVFGVLSLLCCGSHPEEVPGICLSFDDRTIDEWQAMTPILDKYNAKVTFFITQFDSLTNEERAVLHELKSKGHEIGSHGALHVLSEFYIKENGYDAYLQNEIDRSVESMTKAGLKPTAFAYPYGAKYWLSDYLLLKRFKTVRGVAPLQSGDKLSEQDDIYFKQGDTRLLAAGIDHGTRITKEELTEALDRTIRNNEILLLYGHYPGDDKTNIYQFDITLLEFILRSAQERGIKFFTMSEIANFETAEARR